MEIIKTHNKKTEAAVIFLLATPGVDLVGLCSAETCCRAGTNLKYRALSPLRHRPMGLGQLGVFVIESIGIFKVN